MEEKQMEMRRTFGSHRKKNIESALMDQEQEELQQYQEEQGGRHQHEQKTSADVVPSKKSFHSPSQPRREVYMITDYLTNKSFPDCPLRVET